MRFLQNTNYDFLGRRRVLYMVSGALTVLVVALLIFWQFQAGSWLNYGVDFTGGTVMQLRFTEPATEGDIRGVISAVVPGTEVTRFGTENEFLVRAPRFETEGSGTNTSDAVLAALQQRYGDGFEIERTEAVGPKVGNELQRRAAIAIFLSFIATLLYLAFRMEFRFGVAAIIATLHDIMLTLGFISAFRLDVSLPTVAAVLTIVGYSLNDTIVIFDRIRENLKKLGRRHDYADLLNRSVNETLPRTLMTSMSTLAVLVSLTAFTRGALQEFALILIFGIVLGTYSSIFIASPALLEMEKRWPHKPDSRQPRPRRRAEVGV